MPAAIYNILGLLQTPQIQIISFWALGFKLMSLHGSHACCLIMHHAQYKHVHYNFSTYAYYIRIYITIYLQAMVNVECAIEG